MFEEGIVLYISSYVHMHPIKGYVTQIVVQLQLYKEGFPIAVQIMRENFSSIAMYIQIDVCIRPLYVNLITCVLTFCY